MLPVWQTLNTERRSEKMLASQTKNRLRQQYEQHVQEALGGEPVKAELPTPSRPKTTEMMQNETPEQGRFFGGEEAANQAVGAAAKGSSKALKPGTLSNIETRTWYLEQESRISNLLDKKLSLEQQARQAFELRNQFRTEARELMADRNLAEVLNKTEKNLTWEQLVSKKMQEGFSGDELWKSIIESSQKSRASVNESLGLGK